MIRLLMLLLSGLLVVPSAAAARDIFVNNSGGDDRNGGQAPDFLGSGGPTRTIAKALRIARPGDRIIVANTGLAYRECLSVQGSQHSGDQDVPLRIVGNGATLDGTMSLADAQWEHFRGETFRTRPARMSFQQLFLADQPAARRAATAANFPELAPLEWSLLDGWLYFRCEAGKLPQSYELSCCLHPAAITLYDVHDVVIENFVIRGYYLDGVNAHDTTTRTDLVALDCRHNGRSGISIGGASRVRIDTCIAAGNGAAQVRMEGFCKVQLLDNQLDPASAPALVREGGELVTE